MKYPNIAIPLSLPIKDRYKRNSVQHPALGENQIKKDMMILKNNKNLKKNKNTNSADSLKDPYFIINPSLKTFD